MPSNIGREVKWEGGQVDPAAWAAIVTAAISAIGAVVLQALQMYLSYKRDTAIKKDIVTVAAATNGLTQKIVTAELTAERIVAKAETVAKDLIVTATLAAKK